MTTAPTASGIAPGLAVIQYALRAPTIEMQERVWTVLDRNADHVAAMTHCTVRKDWVTKTRPGLPNHAIAQATFDVFAALGAPRYCEEAVAFANALRVACGAGTLPATAVAASTSRSGSNNARHNATASSTPGSTSRITFRAMAPQGQRFEPASGAGGGPVRHTIPRRSVAAVSDPVSRFPPGRAARGPQWFGNSPHARAAAHWPPRRASAPRASGMGNVL